MTFSTALRQPRPASINNAAPAHATVESAGNSVFGTSEKISHSLSGFLLSYAAPHNTYGYDMFRIYPDRDAFCGDLATFSDAVVRYALNLFAGKLLPSDMSAANILTDQGFMNLGSNVVARYESASSDVTAYAGAGITNDDAVIVAVEYGPKAWMNSNRAFYLFDSASLLGYG
jgi:hypothetical protein